MGQQRSDSTIGASRLEVNVLCSTSPFWELSGDDYRYVTNRRSTNRRALLGHDKRNVVTSTNVHFGVGTYDNISVRLRFVPGFTPSNQTFDPVSTLRPGCRR